MYCSLMRIYVNIVVLKLSPYNKPQGDYMHNTLYNTVSNIKDSNISGCQMSMDSNVLGVKCPRLQMSWVSNVQGFKFLGRQMSKVSNVLGVKCPRLQMSWASNVQGAKVSHFKVCVCS